MPSTHPQESFEARLATPADRAPLQRMLELYQYELSDIWDQDLDAAGEYGYALDRYWAAPGNFAYVALVDGHYAGFALVDDQARLARGAFWMDQFFILKKYRRRGLGQWLAHGVIRRHPGRWEVGQMSANLPAQAFWRRAIDRLTASRWKEDTITSGWWQGRIQSFVVPAPAGD